MSCQAQVKLHGQDPGAPVRAEAPDPGQPIGWIDNGAVGLRAGPSKDRPARSRAHSLSWTSTFAPGEFPRFWGWYIISAWAAGWVKLPGVEAFSRK